MGGKDQPQCYFDVELNREPVGRIVFQLFSDVCPKTSQNFLWLCTGEKGTGKTTGKKLCYKGSTFHRVVKNFMIQGGDFTDGNGKGGESIYGGYFEDENFTLKHDKAYLLSMANRGKDTNGSQFFITTHTAPHLDGVHVVFGSIISGFEVIKKIEGLKTDSASRPYADVRVVDCGQLITKSANDVLENMEKEESIYTDSLHVPDPPHTPSLESKSENDNNANNQSKLKKVVKSRQVKKRRNNLKKDHVKKQSMQSTQQEEIESEEEKELFSKREKLVLRPEDIPQVPENRFLLRRDMPPKKSKPKIPEKSEDTVSSEQKPSVSKSGRKIKGRGTMRYHTPTRSKSRSVSVEERGSSETPPHWKEEMNRTTVYQPPSTERWSKGDKLDEHIASRWDDRSNSACESPPPSRWKPGQKPWKPSYVHIDEIKAKVSRKAVSSSGQTDDAKKAPSATAPREPSPNSGESRKGSEKEEGEASSESEDELLKRTSEAVNALERKVAAMASPGSNAVRKTVRMNQRPRNQESSSEENSPVIMRNSNASRSSKKSRKSRSGSRHRSRSRGWSHSSSRSRSRSCSSNYSSRSHSRSRHRRGRSRSRSSTYRGYRSRSYSHSRSRSRTHRGRSRSNSYDSYSSRSRSVSRRRKRRRSDSYRSSGRSRSYRSSSRSSSRRRSHSRSSRYS
uniref:peptidylprolyl isomerase n=1 Tax=Knipowitschia caucasica TaxID=637954 RepID=A0AAV2L3U4_KNICA